ncbi:DISARM system phospholipase D-like protein DrmC [Thermomonospora umbrina]|uniref:phospholipase D n=1 Tax=Thermomonospora umbrina TaxID=111806 RepID=A0A3D9SY62_9ACTN|nr:DISARM system phospholipase D-like protein DrmC [Thermomonospora umbrina]REE98983.1 phospholipase D-like protein [Thermomonospora umbrina]
MPSDHFASLGGFLTFSEAEALAVQFESGQHTVKALTVVNAARREEVKRLLAAAGLNHTDGERAAGVLRAIAGAKSWHRDLTPVWTMPGNEAKVGHLTSEFHRIVQAARQSVVCATYNFEQTSRMWTVLKEASEQPGVVVTVYIDGDKADAVKVKTRLPKATIYQSTELPSGKRVVSHAKFIVIDHEVLMLTSANFSFSAENHNVEFGLLVRDSALAESVESTMASKHGTLYELARTAGRS